MTDTALTILIAAIPPTMASVTAAIVAIVSLLKSNDTNAKIDEAATQRAIQTSKTEKLIEKTTEIHTMANGKLSTVSAALDVATETIRGMQKIIDQGAVNKVETAASQAAIISAIVTPKDHQ